jgi:hypothetical protein
MPESMEVIDQMTRFSEPYRTIVVEPAPARAPERAEPRPERQPATPDPSPPVPRPRRKPVKR